MRAMADETGADAFVRQQRAILERPDSRPQLAEIDIPTLVLVGEADTLTPPALAEEMAQGIHGAHLVVVPECGHLATIERPEAGERRVGGLDGAVAAGAGRRMAPEMFQPFPQ